MSPRLIAALRLLLALCSLALSLTSAHGRPNVLFIVSDDLNMEVGCYGAERGVTPNLDQLASEGIRFDRAYCQYPVCNPSRNSFLSGLRPNETGLPEKWASLRSLIPGVTTLPQLFRENGYYTASIGKVFHIAGWDSRWPDETWELDDDRSWDFRINCPPANQGPERKPPFPRKGIRYDWNGLNGPIDYGMASFEDDLAQDDGQATQEAIRQLDLIARDDRPFFLAVGYRRPHAPFVAPEKYFWPYPLDTIALPDPGDRSDVTDLAFAIWPENHGDPDGVRQLKRCYLASVSFLDSQVGRLLQSLKDHGFAANTIVVFVSDHGFHLGEHGNWHKFTLFEESARVPLIMRVPGVSEPSVRQEFVELIDLFPTLQELCGLPAPSQKLSGSSFVPLLMNRPDDWEKDAAITQVRRGRGDEPSAMGYSIRTADFRYNEWWTEEASPRLLAKELYDLANDPEEEFNQASESRFAPHVEALSTRLGGFVHD